MVFSLFYWGNVDGSRITTFMVFLYNVSESISNLLCYSLVFSFVAVLYIYALGFFFKLCGISSKRFSLLKTFSVFTLMSFMVLVPITFIVLVCKACVILYLLYAIRMFFIILIFLVASISMFIVLYLLGFFVTFSKIFGCYSDEKLDFVDFLDHINEGL